MMGFDNKNYNSDYGSASTSNSGSPWGSMDSWPMSASLQEPGLQLSPLMGTARLAVRGNYSFADVDKNTRSLSDAMDDFKMNGFDSPYDPEENKSWRSLPNKFSGMGPPSGYLRQKSWPEPERSPAAPLPRFSPQKATRPARLLDWPEVSQKTAPPMGNWTELARELSTLSTPVGAEMEWSELAPLPHSYDEEAGFTSQSALGAGADTPITAEQLRVLQSLPNAVLFALLRDLQHNSSEKRGRKRLQDECRFCKNNGERESYYRSHVLKDAYGKVCCPVLRAFVCRRCGASGDRAHTIKYCPLSTEEERNQSVAMMRSVRMASGRRRTNSIPLADPQAAYLHIEAPPSGDHWNLAEQQVAYLQNEASSCGDPWNQQPLGPEWAALEQKLLL